MKVAICEDQQIQAEQLKLLLLAWPLYSKVIESIAVFNSAESFLFSLDDKGPFDLLLLDIQMDDINGIELAKLLRQKKIDSQIIFITAVKEYVFDGYDVNAINYIIKPVTPEKLYSNLEKAMKIIGEIQEKYLVLGKKKININDILYIEVIAHYVHIHTKSELYKFKMNLQQIEILLNQEIFIKCHRSFIINIAKINQITSKDILLDGKITIPLSRSKAKVVNQSFINYHKERVMV